MEQAITVGMVMWFVGISAVVLGVCGLFLWVLSIFADAFKH